MELNPYTNHTPAEQQSKVKRKTGLVDYSPSDKPWNRHRASSDDVSGVYADVIEFEKLSSRINGCSGWLEFAWADNHNTGESRLRLNRAYFCRVRYCPVCQWRRSLMWQARFYQALPTIMDGYPKSRWLFVTLTVRNCEITDLGSTLTAMNKAWNKFIKRADLKPVQGWIRTTEVTHGNDGSAHPHFHILVMVPPSWFQGKYYVKQSRWVKLWQESLQANYAPNVDVRTVKPKKGRPQSEALESVVAETLKYSTKPSDMIGDPSWLLELTRQTHRRRFVASGGVLKDVLKPNEETNDDLLVKDSESDDVSDDDQLLLFGWDSGKREYHRR